MKSVFREPAQGSTKTLAAGVLLLSLSGALALCFLVFGFASHKTYSNRSLEQLLSGLPESPVHFDHNPAIQLIRKHNVRLLPELNALLNGPAPLRYRITRNLPTSASQTLLHWLPPEMAKRLFMSDEEVRRSRKRALQAITLLAENHPSAVRPILIHALERPETDLQRAAIEGIGNLGSDGIPAVPKLIPFLNSDDPKTRFQTSKTLGLLGPASEESLPRLEPLMSDPSEMVRGAVLVAYGRIVTSSNRLHPNLASALDDPSSHVRYAAAQAIGRTACQDPASIKPLISALRDPESQVRRNAAIAIGKMGSMASSAVDPLIAALWDDRMEVRISSAEALGAIGPKAKRAIPHLFDALNNDFAGMGTPAHEAIKKIDPSSDQGISAR